LTIARSMRCVLSFTACSGRPTSTVFGNAPGETSNLDLHKQRIDPQQRKGVQLGEHAGQFSTHALITTNRAEPANGTTH
jgi:hypothetical protein